MIFKQTVVANSNALIRDMEQQTGASKIAYVSRLTDRSHLYTIQLSSGQTVAQLLEALSHLDAISAAEIDSKAIAH